MLTSASEVETITGTVPEYRFAISWSHHYARAASSEPILKLIHRQIEEAKNQGLTNFVKFRVNKDIFDTVRSKLEKENYEICDVLPDLGFYTDGHGYYFTIRWSSADACASSQTILELIREEIRKAKEQGLESFTVRVNKKIFDAVRAELEKENYDVGDVLPDPIGPTGYYCTIRWSRQHDVAALTALTAEEISYLRRMMQRDQEEEKAAITFARETTAMAIKFGEVHMTINTYGFQRARQIMEKEGFHFKFLDQVATVESPQFRIHRLQLAAHRYLIELQNYNEVTISVDHDKVRSQLVENLEKDHAIVSTPDANDPHMIHCRLRKNQKFGAIGGMNFQTLY